MGLKLIIAVWVTTMLSASAFAASSLDAFHQTIQKDFHQRKQSTNVEDEIAAVVDVLVIGAGVKVLLLRPVKVELPTKEEASFEQVVGKALADVDNIKAEIESVLSNNLISESAKKENLQKLYERLELAEAKLELQKTFLKAANQKFKELYDHDMDVAKAADRSASLRLLSFKTLTVAGIAYTIADAGSRFILYENSKQANNNLFPAVEIAEGTCNREDTCHAAVAQLNKYKSYLQMQYQKFMRN